MEFYFGDANLMKSKYLKEKMNEGPWIDLSLFLTFNKLAEIMRNFFERLQNAWKYQNILQAKNSKIPATFEVEIY